MGDAAPGKFPGHIQLTDFDVSLERGDARHPLQPVVQGLRLRVSAKGLEVLAQGLVDEADRRAPVGLNLKGVRVGPDGVDLFLRVEKGIFGSDFSTRIALSAPGGQALRLEMSDDDLPAWVPLEMLLNAAVQYGKGAISRDPDNRRALLLDPAVLLTRFGVPGRFAPGRWSVNTSSNGIELAFRENGGTA
jgi:hypothetical protein